MCKGQKDSLQKGWVLMSYISGFMMGAVIGKQIHNALWGKGSGQDIRATASRQPRAAKEELPLFAIASSIKGRRRYYAAALLRNEGLKKLLEDKLPQVSIVKSVAINTVTGSLLVLHCGTEEQMNELEARMEEHIFKVSFGNKKFFGGHQAIVEEGLAATGTSIKRSVAKINAYVKMITANWFDLRSIASIALIIRGLRKVFAYGQRPSGPQMLWWALSLLRGGRFA